MSRRQILRGAIIVCTLIVTGFIPLVPAQATEGTIHSGFVGTWETIDCAVSGENGMLDCTRWGDGSRRTLHISSGDTPSVTYQDEYSGNCDSQGSPSTHWVAVGKGEYVDLALFVTFFRSGCGRFDEMNPPEGGQTRQFYRDEGSDTIWEDSDGDGWGYMWLRRIPCGQMNP